MSKTFIQRSLNKYIFILSIVLLHSCKNTNIIPPEEMIDDGEIHFNINIASSPEGANFDSQHIKTAALGKIAISSSDNRDNYGSIFTLGDSIGVFAVPSGLPLQATGNIIHNAKITFNGVNWVGDIKWPSGTMYLDFYTYYPYNPQMTDPTNCPFNIKTDQTSIDDFAASDLMSAKRTYAFNGSAVSLLFSHHLSLLQIEIPSQSSATPNLNVDERLEIMLNRLNSSGTFNLANQQFITNNSTYSGIRPYRIENPNSSDYKQKFTYRALVPSQVIEENHPLIFMTQGLTSKIVNQPWRLSLFIGMSQTITFTDFPKDIPTTFIKGGMFIMGNSTNNVRANEIPLHAVTLTKDFYMSKYEITLKQYVDFLNANAIIVNPQSQMVYFNDVTLFSFNGTNADLSPKYNENTKQWFVASGYENIPMTNVTPEGAEQYCKWLGAKLPTEAQWEYATRAGTSTVCFFGNNLLALGSYANISSNTGLIVGNVGQRLPNPYGLYDVYGNVSEITRDNYASETVEPYESSNPQTNPVANNGDYFITRGGSVNDNSPNSYKRSNIGRNSFNSYTGFRVVFEK